MVERPDRTEAEAGQSFGFDAIGSANPETASSFEAFHWYETVSASCSHHQAAGCGMAMAIASSVESLEHRGRTGRQRQKPASPQILPHVFQQAEAGRMEQRHRRAESCTARPKKMHRQRLFLD